MLAPSVVLLCALAHSRFLGGSSGALAHFLATECGVPAFVAGHRQYGELQLENPRALRRFDFLGGRLGAVVPDQNMIAVADSGLPYPHSKRYDQETEGQQDSPSPGLAKILTITGDEVTLAQGHGIQAGVHALANLKWGKKITSNWFLDACTMAFSFDKMSVSDFWRHVAKTICAKVTATDTEIKLVVDYEELKKRWARSLRLNLTPADYQAIGPACEAPAILLERLPVSTVQRLIDKGPTFVRYDLKTDPVAYRMARIYVDARLGKLRDRAAAGDVSSQNLLEMIRGAEPIVTLSSHDFIVNMAVQGPKPNWTISL